MTSIASLVLSATSIVDAKYLSTKIIDIISEAEKKIGKHAVAIFMNPETVSFIKEKFITYEFKDEAEKACIETLFGLEIVASNFLPFGKVVALTSDELELYKQTTAYLNKLNKGEFDGEDSK